MKSIGIYGDSFGTSSLTGTPEDQSAGLSYHWSELLRQEYNCALTNYALSGSSVYYSYKEFERTNHLHDLCIFLVTEPRRYILPLLFSIGNRCVTNEVQIDVWKKTGDYNENSGDLELLHKLECWFELSDLDYHQDMSELMVEKVSAVGSRVIIIPCYEASFRDTYRNQKLHIGEEVNLCSLYYAQMSELRLSDTGMNVTWMENSRFISGHLTPEYNRVAYENISHYVKNRIWDWKIPNSKIINSPNKDNYYTSL